MHDTIRLEELGLPTVAIATTEFLSAARAQAAALGRSGLDLVYVAHPIQDQSTEEIAGRADAVAAEIVAHLTTA